MDGDGLVIGLFDVDGFSLVLYGVFVSLGAEVLDGVVCFFFVDETEVDKDFITVFFFGVGGIILLLFLFVWVFVCVFFRFVYINIIIFLISF